MGQYTVEVSAEIPGSAERIYEILRDYHGEHPAILPKQYFTKLDVIEGGHGEGTLFEAELTVLGIKDHFRMLVSEPEPGRILVEEDKSKGVVTTFTVEPLSNDNRCQVTISTVAKTASGLKGIVERLINPVTIRRIYRAELKQLAAYVIAFPQEKTSLATGAN